MKRDGDWKNLFIQDLPWRRRTVRYHCTQDKYIEVELEGIGKDLLVKVTGGAAHIGAVALGFPDGTPPRLFECAQHREGELAKKIAASLAPLTKTHVCVLAGIHFDGITKFEIASILLAAEIFIEDMNEEFSEKKSMPSNFARGS